MKPLLKIPDHELTWPALWMTLLGLFLGGLGIVGGSLYLATVGVLFIVLGVGTWQEIRPVIWTALGVTLLITVGHLLRAGITQQWRPLAYAVGFASIAWGCWDGLKKQDTQYWDEQLGPESESPDDDAEDDSAEDDDAPMISLVMLRREPRYLESPVLARIVEGVWGGRYQGSEDEEDSDETDGFVLGESPLFVIRSGEDMFLVHNHDSPYWEGKDELAESVGELRLRKAIADHQAWLSVDAIGQETEHVDMDAIYNKIGKLIVALSDPESLAVFCPDSNDINVWSDELAERLESPGGVADLARPNNVPVIPISGDHPVMIAAVEQAQSRLPEFIEAFQDQADGCDNFVIKIKLTVDDVTEFIWADVVGFEPNYVHGRLGNDPVNLGELRLGDPVEAPKSDIQDWGYVRDGQRVGMFSVEAIRQIQAESQSESEAEPEP